MRVLNSNLIKMGSGLIALLVTIMAPAQATEPMSAKTGFGYEDLIRLNRLSGLAVSPDESQAVFAIRATDMAANKGVSALYAQNLNDTSKPHQRLAVSDKGAHSAQWGDDGRLYFLSARSGSTQVWSTNAPFETAQQVTDLMLDVGAFRVGPRGVLWWFLWP